MRAGRLDQRLTIEQYTETIDSHGDTVETWSTLDTVWGELKQLKSSEKFTGNQELAQAEYQIYLRYRSDITPQMRIKIGSDYYDILSVAEIRRHKGLSLMVRRNVA